MRTFKILLAAWFALSLSQSWADTPLDKERVDTPELLLLRTLRHYNSFKSMGQIIHLLKANETHEEKVFLTQWLTGDQLKKAPPLITTKNNKLNVKGLEKPIDILDLKEGLYSYDGREFTLSFKHKLSKSLTDLEQVLFPKRTAWLNWLLPEANAAVSQNFKDTMVGLTTGLTVAQMFMCFSGLGSGQVSQQAMYQPNYQPNPYAYNYNRQPYYDAYGNYVIPPNNNSYSPSMMSSMPRNSCEGAGAGIIAMIMAMNLDVEKKPEFNCYTNGNGMQTLTVTDYRGNSMMAPMMWGPGQPAPVYRPNMALSSIQSQQAAMAQIRGLCQNPMALAGINQTIATVPPAVLAPTVYAAPRAQTVQSAQPVTSSGKPSTQAVRKPAAKYKPQAKGRVGYAEVATGSR